MSLCTLNKIVGTLLLGSHNVDKEGGDLSLIPHPHGYWALYFEC